jgi:glutamyl-tRNA reductase
MRHAQQSLKTFPVNLLLDGRGALVVGGGKVARHKVELLMESGARIRVVAPEIHPEILALAAAGQLQAELRPFTPADLDGMKIAFAATGNPEVNAEVLRLAREQGVVACSVDALWAEGAFVTPAVVRAGHVVVSVSTGGLSCRHARLVKAGIKRHLQLAGRPNLVVLGLSHQTLDLERREPFHLAGERLEAAGKMVRQLCSVHEFMIFNTCNRIELVAVMAPDAAAEEMMKRILGFDRLNPEDYYLHRGEAAFAHVALTLAGLFSQTPGEKHVVAQFKEAMEQAQEADWAGIVIREWLESTLHLARQIRQHVAPHLHGVEIEDIAVEWLRSRLETFEGKRVLVIGTGMVGSELILRLLEEGAACSWCWHANQPELPSAWNAGRDRLNGFAAIPAELATADAVVCVTGSQEAILTASQRACFATGRRTAIADLGIPRNVDPALAGNGIEIVDLDDLKHWHRREQADLDRLVAESREIVHQEIGLYDKIIRGLAGH